jgi:predicted choloylglycine hydrolase
VITFEAIEEFEPGPRWAALFERHWPRYRAWFLHEGESARTSYAASLRALEEHMPELLPTYERVCGLAGGGDIEARFLGMWAPPSYLAGCSQAVWQVGDPILARNYDYAPERLEGTILHTRWVRPVIGSGDCAWGLLDGLNDAGLAVSLAFGGRKVVGSGFGVPLVVRYLLETCETTGQARETLRRLPYHLAHTLTIVDAEGDVCTAFIAPDRDVVLTEAVLATNHQGRVEWHEHARATKSVERERALERLVGQSATSERFVDGFLQPPLFAVDDERRLGTVYTVAYHVREAWAEFRWPEGTWDQRFGAFTEGVRVVALAQGEESLATH